MYLIDHALDVVPAIAEPAREEDPFSLMAYDLFKPLYEKVCEQRGKGVRIAIAIANCFGGWTFCDPQVRTLVNRGPKKVSAFLSVAWFPAAPQGRITIKEQLTVPAQTFSAEFHAFYDALTMCRFWLERGICDVAFAGATETVGSPFMSKAYGPDVTHDAAVWFVLAQEGEEALRIHAGPPPSDIATSSLSGDTFKGTSLRGACALPLLLLEVLRHRPRALRVPGRALMYARDHSLELWRQDSQ
jgi:hypothetical protein